MEAELPVEHQEAATGPDDMIDQSPGYVNSHASAGYGARYRRTYERGYYAAQWRDVERPLLIETLRHSIGVGADKSCLDFACGTGRITEVVAGEYGEVVGVDVSAAMLAEARKPPNVTLLQVDLTRRELGRQFDAAVAFRFFLNAEDALRRQALNAIHAHLKPGAALLCNIHMSASSPMGVVYRIAKAVRGRVVHEVLTPDAFVTMLADTGFTADRIIHYGYLPRPGRFLPALCERLVLPVERLCRGVHMPERWSQSFLVVARKPIRPQPTT